MILTDAYVADSLEQLRHDLRATGRGQYTDFVAEREMLRRQRLRQLPWNYRPPADHELIGDALNHAVRIGSLDGP